MRKLWLQSKEGILWPSCLPPWGNLNSPITIDLALCCVVLFILLPWLWTKFSRRSPQLLHSGGAGYVTQNYHMHSKGSACLDPLSSALVLLFLSVDGFMPMLSVFSLSFRNATGLMVLWHSRFMAQASVVGQRLALPEFWGWRLHVRVVLQCPRYSLFPAIDSLQNDL